MKNLIRGTEYENFIYQTVDANADCVDLAQCGRWEIIARMEIAAEHANNTREAIQAAILKEMDTIVDETPAPHDQTQ